MTRSQIIEETAAFYNTSNRGMISSVCVYNNNLGDKCAVGRCMNEFGLLKFGDFRGNVSAVKAECMEKRYGDGLDCILKEDYQNHPVEFWSSLQSFHDYNRNWDEYGLTKVGLAAKERLLEKWAEKDI